MIKHYRRILSDTEKRAEYFLKYQIMDETLGQYGGLLEENGLVQPKHTLIGCSLLIALYLNNESRFYNNMLMLERAELGVDYSARMQRPDGTFDYILCNFYASPDTAFSLWSLIPTYRLLAEKAALPKEIELKEKIYSLMERAGHGIASGGFHTPNHRWAIACTLMALCNITGNESFRTAADSYLIEGIDGNEYGEYAERSAGNYNQVNNDAMIMLAEETGDDTYLGYVERNLVMMRHYFDPDGSVFTNNSTRQDNGRKVYPGEYYYEYLYMAKKNGNPVFAAAANRIMEDVIERGMMAPDCLCRLMMKPELIQYELEGDGFLDSYREYYKESGIARVKRGDVSYSLIEKGSRFLYFQVGAISTYMKIGVPFFEQREFRIQSMEQTEKGFVMHYNARGWYYKPFKEKPATTDWWAMDNKSRELHRTPDLSIVVTLEEIEGGIQLNMKADGCDRVPLKVELGFSTDTQVKADSFLCDGAAGGAVTVVSGNVRVCRGMDVIKVGPAFANHNFAGGNFGSEPRSLDHFTIYFTDFTNFDRTITLQKD